VDFSPRFDLKILAKEEQSKVLELCKKEEKRGGYIMFDP
jgi:hypothetical protein